jgi:oxygen-independent coproporphyrinogen-3 oxidase
MMEEIHSIFAVGAGAVSKMVSRDGRTIERIFEYKYPYEYLAEASGIKNEEKVKKITEFYQNIW